MVGSMDAYGARRSETAPARFRLAPARRTAAAARRRLQAEFAEALAGDAFRLVYYPRRVLWSGRRSGAEAVVRWPCRNRGTVPSGAVLPLAEECDAVAATGAWTLGRACADAGTWPDGVVSVGISPQLLGTRLLAIVQEALGIAALPPERLSLELPEAALAKLDFDSLLILSALRDLGCGLVVDDFGSAVASLNLLRRLPLTGLKLDRVLVRDLPGEREDGAMVCAIVGAAHALGMAVIAKGVDTEAQRACLAALGCDEGQGYLYSQERGGCAAG